MQGVVLAFLCVSAACGWAMIVLGLRGRKVNDNPSCRRCRFDLGGLYPDVSSCPECGRRVGPENPPRPCVRERRPGLILVGVVLLVVPAGVGFSLLNPRAAGLKPDMLLRWEIEHFSAEAAVAALQELNLRRARDGGLTTPPDPELVEAILARQADTDRGWSEALGDAIEEWFVAGLIGSDVFRRYVEQMPIWVVSHQPRARRGEPLDIFESIHWRGWSSDHRGGNSSRFLRIATLAGAEIGGDPLPVEPAPTRSIVQGTRSGLWPNSGFITDASGLKAMRIASMDVSPGTHALTTDWRIEIIDSRTHTVVLSWDETRVTDIEVLAPDRPLTSMVTGDPELRAEVEESITLTSLTYGLPSRGQRSVRAQFSVIPLSIDCAWSLELLLDGEKVDFLEAHVSRGSSLAGKGDGGGGQDYVFHVQLSADVPLERAGRVTVILLSRSRPRGGRSSARTDLGRAAGIREREDETGFGSLITHDTGQPKKQQPPAQRTGGCVFVCSWGHRRPCVAARLLVNHRSRGSGGGCDERECAHSPAADRSAWSRRFTETDGSKDIP